MRWKMRVGGREYPTSDTGSGPIWIIFDNVGGWHYPIGAVRAPDPGAAFDEALGGIFQDPYEDDIDLFEMLWTTAMAKGESPPELPDGIAIRPKGVPRNELGVSGLATMYASKPEGLNTIRLATPLLLQQESIDLVSTDGDSERHLEDCRLDTEPERSGG